MKKQLFTILTSLATVAAIAQPSPQWTINQQAVFPSAPATATPGIRYLDAVDPNVIWVIGYDGTAPNRHYNWFSRSTNGGSSFSGGDVLSDTNTYAISNMEGIDANTAWVSCYNKNVGNGSLGALFRTTNGGASWQNMTSSSMYTNSASFCNIVSFFTPSVGITMGDPNNGGFEIWRTTNGGLSWSQVPQTNIPANNTGEFGIVNLYYKLGTSNLWYGTNAGRMYRTTDAGVTWSVATVAASSATLLEIAFSTPLKGITYVWNGASTDVYNTIDGGATWTLITPNGNIGYADVVGVPGTGVLASFGSGTNNNFLSYSTDNGLNWTDWNSAGIQYLTGDFVDGSNGWAGSFDFASVPITNIWKYSGPTITGNVIPTAAFTMPLNLCGPNVTITPANSTTATPAPTYSWSSQPPGVQFSSPTSSAPVITFTSNTTYTITMVATNTVGSNASHQVVTVNNCVAPVAAFSLQAVNPCLNIPFTTSNSSTGGTPAPSYSWIATPSANVSFSPSAVADNPTVVATTPGTYTITLIATNNVSSVSATQTVNVVSCSPMATFSLNKTTVKFCDPNDRKVGSINATALVPGAGANTYTWSIFPSTGIQYNTGSTAVNYSVTVTNTLLTSYVITLKAKNVSGISTYTMAFNVDFDQALCEVGVGQIAPLSGIRVFPNPAHDVLNVQLKDVKGSSVIRLTNLLGTVVSEEKVAEGNDVTVQLAGKAKGIYFLTIENGSSKETRKIVVE